MRDIRAESGFPRSAPSSSRHRTSRPGGGPRNRSSRSHEHVRAACPDTRRDTTGEAGRFGPGGLLRASDAPPAHSCDRCGLPSGKTSQLRSGALPVGRSSVEPGADADTGYRALPRSTGVSRGTSRWFRCGADCPTGRRGIGQHGDGLRVPRLPETPRATPPVDRCFTWNIGAAPRSRFTKPDVPFRPWWQPAGTVATHPPRDGVADLGERRSWTVSPEPRRPSTSPRLVRSHHRRHLGASPSGG